MQPVDPQHFETPKAFRAWLAAHHAHRDVLWVAYWKKATGRPTVTWEETVDEALCFGWIDGIRQSLGEEAYTVRFTPRKPASVWSGRNVARWEAMVAAGKMTPAGREAYAHRDTSAPNDGYRIADLSEEPPDWVVAGFADAPVAWAFFAAQPPGVRKQSLWWVVSAKREATRQRRLAVLIEDSLAGRRIKQLRR